MTAAFTHDDISAPHAAHHSSHRRPIPVGVQVLSTILFGAFAITVTAIAFSHFWPAGVALAVILGWRGGFVPLGKGEDPAHEIIAEIRGLSPEAQQRSSGNASFDAYRTDTLERLEVEQENFSDFLDRLREARDQREFDGFMDSRAAAARAARLENDEA
ncbi:MAG TPA: hypothetical protein DIU07_04450 [Rhodobacteraceae bacterium]|nr:hypothetical protein [Paracoccaceae bacterium]